MQKTKEILDFWENFKLSEQCPNIENEEFDIDEYGDSSVLRDELVSLILKGKKTATCASLFQYQYEGIEIPSRGDKRVVVDGAGTPVCITEIVEVTLEKFGGIKEDFAYDEGEGDRSLEYWRKSHWQYFSRVLPPIGCEVSEEMMLVCEKFRVIYNPTTE